MKNLVLAGLVAVALTSACNQTVSTETENAGGTAADTVSGINGLFHRYWEQESRLHPLDATAQDDNRYNDQLPNDQTQAYRDTLRNFYQRSLTQLQQFDRAALSENDKISYDIFAYEMKQRLEGLKLNTWMMPFNQMGGLPLTLGQYGAGESAQPFKTVRDYENWLGRLRGFPAWADSAIGNFRRGMEAGVVLPRTLVVKMIPQMRGQDIVVTDPTKSLFYAPLTRFPDSFSAADKDRLTKDYQQAIRDVVVPTYQKLGNFLEQEYLPKARKTSGINAVTGGPNMYRYYVQYWTTTPKTPAEIHAIGLREVARIRGEMEKVKEQVGFQGDLRAFLESVKSNPKLMPYKSADEILAAFHAIQDKIDPNLKKIFGRVPKTPFEIRQTEAFRAASASAEYMQGSPNGNRPGIFYIPIVDATQFNVTSGMESLFLHEAIPGHHYQISLQQENPDLPKFRRFAWYGAMGEGWALYCESLGEELGLYTDPYQHLGALSDEMLRAVRLVVDTGIHTGEMTREQAIEYMLNNLSTSRADATSAIERYMAWPGQALSYKIGALKIQELRQRYTEKLGAAPHLREHAPGQYKDHFSLSAFHDELLKDGVMPLELLEKKMDLWAARQRDR